MTEDAGLLAYLDRLAGIPPRAIPHDEPDHELIAEWFALVRRSPHVWPQVKPREQPAREQRKGPRASRFGNLGD